MSPTTGSGQRAMTSSSCAGATPLLPGSPATLTSTSTSTPEPCAVLGQLAQDGVAGHGVDAPHVRQHLAHLAALQVADEVPGERRAVRPGGRLGLELLRAVLAQQRDAGLGQRAELLRRHVLDGREHLDRVRVAAGRGTPRRSSRARARGCRGRARRPATRSAPPHDPRLAAGHAAVAAVAEEALRVAHRAQRRRRATSSTPAAASCPRAIALRSTVRPRVAERGAHLVADLVAARPRARADGGGDAARRLRGAARRRPRPRSRRPALATRRAASPPPPGATSAIGRQSATSTIGATPARVDDLAVGVLDGPRCRRRRASPCT